MITMNWTPIGLNWTILFKCLEMTFVVIWRYINKTELNWILLQCKLCGKAQEVMAAIPLKDSLNYESVKAAVLQAYELVPEAYRQKFQQRKSAGQTAFLEFAREKAILFDKWCFASKANDYDSLRELILLEDWSAHLIVFFVFEWTEGDYSCVSCCSC